MPRLMSSAGKGAAGQLAISAAADAANQASEADDALAAPEPHADDPAEAGGSPSPSERMLPGYLRSFNAIQRVGYSWASAPENKHTIHSISLRCIKDPKPDS